MAKIRQEINITTAIAGTGSGIVLTDWGYVQVDTSQYSGQASVTYYFEVVVSTAAAGSTVTLRRKGTTTDDASVAGTSTGRVRSSSFTPPSGQTEYGIYSSNTTVRVRAARIIIIQDTGTGTLPTTETQIEVGNLESRAGTSIAALTYPKYWKYIPSDWDGVATYYAEVTSKTASTNTHTVRLQEDDGLFGNWTTKVVIVSAVSGTASTRRRSAAFTPTAGRNYRIAALSSSATNGYTIYNAKIIIQQRPSYLVNDTFTEASDAYLDYHAPDSGHSWSPVWQDSGTDQFIIWAASDDITPTSGAGGGMVYICNYNAGNPYPMADYTVQAVVKTLPGDNVKPIFLVGRWQDTSDFYVLGFFGTFIRLYKCVSATMSQVGSDVSYTLAVGDVIGFKLSSSNLYALVNGVALGTFSDSGVSAAGRAGVAGGDVTNRIDNSFSANTWVIDNFCVFDGQVTKLEPQYLLLNTRTTGWLEQSFPTRWDTDEWGGVSNVYRHAMDATNAASSALLYGFGLGLDSANEGARAQAFMPSASGSIDKIDIYVAIATGSPSDDLTLELFSDAPEGTLLGTAPIDVTGVNGSYQSFTGTFSPAVAVTANTTYYFAVRRYNAAASSSNNYTLGNNTGSSYTRGHAYSRDGGDWVSEAWNLRFIVYLSSVANQSNTGTTNQYQTALTGGYTVTNSSLTGTTQKLSAPLNLVATPPSCNLDTYVSETSNTVVASRIIVQSNIGGTAETSTVLYNAAIGSTGTGTSSSGSLNHAANVLVVITVAYAGTTSPLSVTVGSISALSVKKQSQSTNMTCEVYTLYRDAAATETVQVNFNASTRHAFSAVSYTGAKRTVECINSATGSATSPQTCLVNVASGTYGRRIIGCVAARDNAVGTGSITITPANDETERDERALAGGVSANSFTAQLQDIGGSAARDVIATAGKSGRTINWAIVGLALVPEYRPTVTLETPASAGEVAAAIFEFTGSDTNNDSLTYQVQISDVAFPSVVFDAFKDNSVDLSLWTPEGNIEKVVETGGKLQISHGAATDEYNTLATISTYNLTGTSFYVALTDVGNQTYVSHESIFGIRLDENNAAWMSTSDGELFAYRNVGGTSTQIGTSIAYDSVNHKYLRIRESGGTTYFDTSANGSSWTNRWSLTNPFALTAIQPYVQSGLWQNEAGGSYSCFENFNINATVFVDKISGQDTGFENVDTPADTDPYTPGNTVRYTDATLPGGTYYWRVRGGHA